MDTINYVLADRANNSTLVGWNKYKDTALALPVDGISGVPAITFTRSAPAQLRNIGDFLFTKPIGNSQGEGVSYDFFIDPQYKNSRLYIEFIYDSTNLGPGDVGVYVYDRDNSTLITPELSEITPGTVPTRFLTTFQTSNASNYRLIFHVKTTTNPAYSILFSDFFIGIKNFKSEYNVLSVKAGNYTASESELIPVDSGSGSFSITLPASPKNGDKIAVHDVGASLFQNPVTVLRNGKSIGGFADDLILDIDNSYTELYFNAELDSWFVLET